MPAESVFELRVVGDQEAEFNIDGFSYETMGIQDKLVVEMSPHVARFLRADSPVGLLLDPHRASRRERPHPNARATCQEALMAGDSSQREVQVASERVFQGRILGVRVDTVRLPDGREDDAGGPRAPSRRRDRPHRRRR